MKSWSVVCVLLLASIVAEPIARAQPLPDKAAPSKPLKTLLAKALSCPAEEQVPLSCKKGERWWHSGWHDDPAENERWTVEQRLRARAAMLALLRDKNPRVRYLALEKLRNAPSITDDATAQEVALLLDAADAATAPKLLDKLGATLAHRAFDETLMKRATALARTKRELAVPFVWNCCNATLGKHTKSAEMLALVLEMAASSELAQRHTASAALTSLARTFPKRGCPALVALAEDAETRIASEAMASIPLAGCRTAYKGVLDELARVDATKPLPAKYARFDLILLHMCESEPTVRPRARKLLETRVAHPDATCQTLDAAVACDKAWGAAVARRDTRPAVAHCAPGIADRAAR